MNQTNYPTAADVHAQMEGYEARAFRFASGECVLVRPAGNAFEVVEADSIYSLEDVTQHWALWPLTPTAGEVTLATRAEVVAHIEQSRNFSGAFVDAAGRHVLVVLDEVNPDTDTLVHTATGAEPIHQFTHFPLTPLSAQ